MDMYHRTNWEAAQKILSKRFRDGTGTYMTVNQYSGVWLTNTEFDPSAGELGDTLLKVSLRLGEDDLAVYEWVEECKGYQEWLVPAAILNANMTVEIVDRDTEPEWAGDR